MTVNNLHPEEMNDFHLRAAIKKLAKQMTNDQALYRTLEAELSKRESLANSTLTPS